MNYICAFILLILLSDIILVSFLKRDLFLKTKNLESEVLVIGLSTTLIAFVSSLFMSLVSSIVSNLFKYTSYEQLWYLFITALVIVILEAIFRLESVKVTDTIRYYIPLVTVNATALSTFLLSINADFSFINILMTSLASGLGLTLVLYLFSLVKRQIKQEKIPKILRGIPIYVIVVIIMIIIVNQCVIYL